MGSEPAGSENGGSGGSNGTGGSQSQVAGGDSVLADFFDFAEHGTNLRTEILAGLTTFLSMSYIVVVNPAIMTGIEQNGQVVKPGIIIEGMSAPQVRQMLAVVTILAAFVAIIVMAVYAKRPFAQAPGLGLNAFFAFTVVGALGVPWETALAAVVVEGVIFIILTVAGARKYIIELFPVPVKFAVGTGIGLFLAIIGLENMRLVAGSPATFLTFNPIFVQDPIALISIVGLFLTFVLYVRGIRGSIVIGIIATTLAGYAASLANVTAPNPQDAPFTLLQMELTPNIPPPNYDISPLVGAFIQGFQNVEAFTFALIVFTFFFVDFFDTAGTLTGVSQMAGFLDDEGNLPEIEKPLMADAIGTTVGGMIGTSTVTTYIESATGIEEGGRSGMTALTVGGLFLVSLALVPLAAAIPLYASHIALVMVGLIMMRNVTDIDWSDLTHALPAGMTILIMPFAFSIAFGIAAGIISYPLVKAAQGEAADVSYGQWGLAAAFVVYFVVRTGGVL